MPWRYYVYEHYRADSGEVFYVGKGSYRANRSFNPERAVAENRRNIVWRNTVAKAGGFTWKIIACCPSDRAAQEVEKQRIAMHGRRQTGDGPLVNFTDGGDGHAGVLVSDELRAKRSANAKKPRSQAWVSSIRAARKNGGNGGVVKTGDKLPETWVENLSRSKIGNKNPMYGKTGVHHPRSKAVVDTKTGTEYVCIKDAAEAAGIAHKSMCNMLRGHRRNKTSMRLVDAP